MDAITEDELLRISAKTNTRLEAFVKSPKPKSYELASLAHQIIKDMGRPTNMIGSLVMMQTLRELRDNELKEDKGVKE